MKSDAPLALIDRLIELTATRERQAMDACIVDAVRALLGARQVEILRLLGDAGDERWLVAASVQGDGEVRTADASWIDLNELPTLDDQPQWAQWVRRAEQVISPGVQGVQAVWPLQTYPGISGLLLAQLDEAPQALDCHAVRGLLEIFRNQLATLDYTESDTLTGLLNRKSFDETFYRASALPMALAMAVDNERRQPIQQRYWLGVIDVDHFKLVNDRFGHLIGDEVLLLLSRVMRQSFRFQDKLYRFGGEEFVVLLRCPDEEAAMVAMDRFRRRVEQQLFPRAEHVTVSVGFTDVRVGDTPPAAVERADLAVYYAKHQGRNQVRSHAALVRAGELADANQSGDVEFF